MKNAFLVCWNYLAGYCVDSTIMKIKKRIKKEAVEWIFLLTIFGIIYLGGWHTEVIGRIQQVFLATGVLSPDSPDNTRFASYSFELEDLDGNLVDFHDFEGEVVFLNFWATWCPPCVAEMPDIHALFKETEHSVSFVLISLDKDKQKARDYIKRKEFTFPVYFLRSQLPTTYSVDAIPTTYLLAKDGKIHIENHGMAKYNTENVKNLIKELSESQQVSGNTR